MKPSIEHRIAALERDTSAPQRLILMKIVDPLAPHAECRYARIGDELLTRSAGETEQAFESRVALRLSEIFTTTGATPQAVLTPFDDEEAR